MDTLQVDEYTDRDHLIKKKLAMREKRQLHDILWSFYSWSGCSFFAQRKNIIYIRDPSENKKFLLVKMGKLQ
jgi:hypothetical protein